MNRWPIAICCVLATSAHAGGLAWHAPSECPDDAAVRTAIERRLEAPLDSVALAVDVDITHDDVNGFSAQVRVTGTDSRTLTSASCAELTDAVAVVVARLATEARSAAPPPSPPAPPAIVARVARVEPGHTWNAGVRTTALVGSGNVPSIGGAGELAAWASWDHAFLELSAARWLTRRASVDDTTMAGVDVQLDTLAIRGGGHFGIVRAWLGGELGTLSGNGVGLTAPHAGTSSWRTIGGGAALAVALVSHVRGVVGLDLEIAIDRVQFALDSGEVIYRTSAVALRGGVGIELDLR